MKAWPVLLGLGAGAGATYVGLVTGACPLDLGIGRQARPLGPLTVDITAPREVVFDVIAEPYVGRASRAMADKVRVLERGTDMVLAAHITPVHRWLRATTIETVRFTRPQRVDFRLVRGPVPYVVESFVLDDSTAGTQLTYRGELATDLWRVGRAWGTAVAARWQSTVATSLEAIKTDAERRAR